MNKHEIREKLYICFPDSFINKNGEFIAHKKANIYFNLANCETELDVKCKVLEWFSRAAFKSQPFNSNYKNHCLHEFFLNGINKFLETNFNETDIEEIYTYLGNAIKHQKTIEFIESGYDMTFFNQFRQQMTLC